MGKLFAVLNGVLIVGYPLAVYLGLTRLRARELSLVLLALLLPGLVRKLLQGAREHARHGEPAPREHMLRVALVPLSVFALVGLSALLDDARFVLALPSLINLTLFLQFALSLRGVPMIERFARLQDPQLGPAQVSYCRSVTKVWCAFFVGNGALSAYLALFATLASWALYTGLIAYLLIGLLGAAEYLVRKARFREYGQGLHDRLIARLFPPALGAEGAPGAAGTRAPGPTSP
jgi:uncharacterized membrane protein